MTRRNAMDNRTIKVASQMYIVEASFDPLGGLNKQKWVGLTYDQAASVRKKFVGEEWGYVNMYPDNTCVLYNT